MLRFQAVGTDFARRAARWAVSTTGRLVEFCGSLERGGRVSSPSTLQRQRRFSRDAPLDGLADLTIINDGAPKAGVARLVAFLRGL